MKFIFFLILLSFVNSQELFDTNRRNLQTVTDHRIHSSTDSHTENIEVDVFTWVYIGVLAFFIFVTPIGVIVYRSLIITSRT